MSDIHAVAHLVMLVDLCFIFQPLVLTDQCDGWISTAHVANIAGLEPRQQICEIWTLVSAQKISIRGFAGLLDLDLMKVGLCR